MSLSPTSHLVRSLDELQLLSASQRAELERDVMARFESPKALAAELLRRGWLTPYQVNQLLQGRSRELRLGHYVFLERLGEGGTGQVFKARHRSMNRIVALKIIRPELTADPEVVARFYREIQVISQLDHPNIIHAYDAGPEGATHTLIMEYVEGTDLAKLVKQSGPLPVDRACDYIRQAACGLAHAHQRGLIHRDIKPSNLLLAHAPGLPSSGIVKVLDLGLARLQRTADGELTSTLTPVGSVTMGTPDYLAPEQALNFHQVDIRADIYSLGCTLFFLLTGQPPFPGGSLAQKILRHQQAEPPRLEKMRPDLPPKLPAVVYRMLAKLPADRYQTPAELAAALGALRGLPSTPAPAMNTGTVPDYGGETIPRATAVQPTGGRTAFDATVKQYALSAALGAMCGGTRRHVLAAGVIGMILAGLVGAGFLLVGRGQPRAGKGETGREEKPNALGRLDRLQGQVFIGTGVAGQPARLGAELRPGQQVRTAGPDSLARLNLDDRVFLELGPDTALEELPTEKGGLARKVKMDGPGVLQGEVRKGSPERSLVLIGPYSEAKIIHGRFRLAGTPQMTWLRVDEGTVQLKQPGSAQFVEVPAGNYAHFGPAANAVVKPLAASVRVVDDFETARNAWWPYGGPDQKNPRLTRRWVSPGKVGKKALRVDYDLGPTPIPAGLVFEATSREDWSTYRCLHFWFHGSQSSNTFGIPVNADGGILRWHLKDDFAGWREFCVPLDAFKKENGAQCKPTDFRGMSRMEIVTYSSGKGSFQLDQLQLLEHEILR